MPFTGSYTISQGYNPSKFILADNSVYTDEPQNTFSGRRIYLYKIDGTTLVPDGVTTDYIDFPFDGGNQIELDVLTHDFSLNILVEWISNNPQPGSVYDLQVVYTFLQYTKQFTYNKIQTWRAYPNVVNDNSFWGALQQVHLEIKNAELSNRYQDQHSAQWAIDRAKNYIDKSQLFF